MTIAALAQKVGSVHALLFIVSPVSLCLPCHCHSILCRLDGIVRTLCSLCILSLLAFSFLWFVALFAPNSNFFFPYNMFRVIFLDPFLESFTLC